MWPMRRAPRPAPAESRVPRSTLRAAEVWLHHIDDACWKIRDAVGRRPRGEVEGDVLRYDAVLHNLAVIGEAVEMVPRALLAGHPNVPWKKIAALREVVAPQEFGVDRAIVWDAVQNKVVLVQGAVQAILEEARDR